jgi:heme-degrading monooxygenase HmoA
MTIVTVFSSRVRPEASEDYAAVGERMTVLAASMPGFLSHQYFRRPDGVGVTIVRFADEASQRAWAEHPEHVAAQRRGIEEFYEFYDISVATETYHHAFAREDSA